MDIIQKIEFATRRYSRLIRRYSWVKILLFFNSLKYRAEILTVLETTEEESINEIAEKIGDYLIDTSVIRLY